MTVLKYYLRDALQGIKRNFKAFIATVILICISLSIMGSFLLVKQSANGVIDFLETQVKIKVFLEEGAEVKPINEAINDLYGVKETTVETKEEMLERMKGFFEGKEYLFDAFQNAEFPYTILVEADDEKKIDAIVEKLGNVEGIQDIVYPQTFAKEVLKWTDIINQYGLGLLVIFLFVSFLTTQLAISLSIFQRKKEIRIKLLLGAKESHVRRQFLFEGWIMAFIGSVCASAVLYILEKVVMTKLYDGLPFVFQNINHQMNIIYLSIISVGSLVGIIAAYLATRGMMKDA